MLMDEPTLRALVRWTARLSAALFVVALFAFAARRRMSSHVAVRLFLAFVAAHAVHFSVVFLLAWVTDGANLRARGGYVLTSVVGVIFGAGAVAGILRMRSSHPTRAVRFAGALGIGFIWFAFTATYAGRALDAPVFAIPAIFLTAAFLGFLNESRRGANSANRLADTPRPTR